MLSIRQNHRLVAVGRKIIWPFSCFVLVLIGTFINDSLRGLAKHGSRFAAVGANLAQNLDRSSGLARDIFGLFWDATDSVAGSIGRFGNYGLLHQYPHYVMGAPSAPFLHDENK